MIMNRGGMHCLQAVQERCGGHVDAAKAQALARSISELAAPAAAALAVATAFGGYDLESASLAAARSLRDGFGVGFSVLTKPLPQQHPAAAEASSAYSRGSGGDRRGATHSVSARAAVMLDAVSRLLCVDLVLLTLVGPPDRSFLSDAAGVRPGAKALPGHAFKCLSSATLRKKLGGFLLRGEEWVVSSTFVKAVEPCVMSRM